ncbi:MAG: ABC transporter ATP-binding protein [Novosphingobium sp.]
MSLSARDLTLKGRLAGITANLRPGEVTAIVGPNGAGKSSLLACLAGLLDADSGTVSLAGEAIAAMPPRRRARAIGYLPQSPEVAWDVSVEVLVSLGRLPWQAAPMHRAAASPAQDHAAIEAAIQAMDLVPLRRRPLSRLSGGERARVLLARVLAGEPRWLLADEPLANLDLSHAATLMQHLASQARQGAGVVVVLHDLAAAMNHADRVLVLKQGALVTDGPPGTALSGAVIKDVWNMRGHWLGDPGARALALSVL